MIVNKFTRAKSRIETVYHYAYSLISGRIAFKSFPGNIPYSTIIEINKKGKMEVGRDFYLREDNKIECIDGHITIGNHVFFNKGCMITCLNSVIIGNNCIFGPNCFLFDHDHKYDDNQVYLHEFKLGSIIIEDNCWFGSGVVILKDTHIGKGCVISAGAIVKGEIPPHSIVYGKGNYKAIEKR